MPKQETEVTEKRKHVVRGTHLNRLRWTNQSRVALGVQPISLQGARI